jgi:hypothetical protein
LFVLLFVSLSECIAFHTETYWFYVLNYLFSLISMHSQLAVERCNSKSSQQAAKQKALLEVLKLHHLYETAQMLVGIDTTATSTAPTTTTGAATATGTTTASASAAAIRSSMNSLLPRNVASTLQNHLRAGRLQSALLVCQRCVRGPLPLPLSPVEAVRLVPTASCAGPQLDEYLRWVREAVVGRLTAFTATAPGAATGAGAGLGAGAVETFQAQSNQQQQDVCDSLLAVIAELLERARVVEGLTGAPFEAVRLLDLATELGAAVSYASSSSSTSDAAAGGVGGGGGVGGVKAQQLIAAVHELYGHLLLQKALWERWSDEIRLEEVASLGLQGLVFDRIDSTPESALLGDLQENIIPLVQEFCGAAGARPSAVAVGSRGSASAGGASGVDRMLQGWVEESIATRIIVESERSGGGSGSGSGVCGGARGLTETETEDAGGAGVEEGDSGTCTLSRLVKVTSIVKDPNVQARLVLLLLQMPVLEEMSFYSAANAAHAAAADQEDAEDGEQEADGTGAGAGVVVSSSISSSKAAVHSKSNLATTRLLCQLASSAAYSVDSATRDALTEAVRLLKIKALAASYGVGCFDPRNSKHVRAVVSMIASSVHRPQQSIRDAVEFAESWGRTSIDMSAVLTRAMLLRATHFALFSSQSVQFESHLQQSLECLPGELVQVVCEDCMTFLLQELQDESDKIVYDPCSSSGGISGIAGNSTAGESGTPKQRSEMLVRAATLLVSFYLDSLREDAGARAGAGAGAGVGVGAAGAAVAGSPTPVAQLDSGAAGGGGGGGEAAGAPAMSPSAPSAAAGAGGAAGAVQRAARLQQERSSSWVTTELLYSLKRLHTLQTAHGIFLCLTDISDNEVCQAVVAKLAQSRVQQLLRSPEVTADAERTRGRLTAANNPLSVQCRKVCQLLNVHSTYFTHYAMKLLVEASQTVGADT